VPCPSRFATIAVLFKTLLALVPKYWTWAGGPTPRLVRFGYYTENGLSLTLTQMLAQEGRIVQGL